MEYINSKATILQIDSEDMYLLDKDLNEYKTDIIPGYDLYDDISFDGFYDGEVLIILDHEKESSCYINHDAMIDKYLEPLKKIYNTFPKMVIIKPDLYFGYYGFHYIGLRNKVHNFMKNRIYHFEDNNPVCSRVEYNKNIYFIYPYYMNIDIVYNMYYDISLNNEEMNQMIFYHELGHVLYFHNIKDYNQKNRRYKESIADIFCILMALHVGISAETIEKKIAYRCLSIYKKSSYLTGVNLHRVYQKYKHSKINIHDILSISIEESQEFLSDKDDTLYTYFKSFKDIYQIVDLKMINHTFDILPDVYKEHILVSQKYLYMFTNKMTNQKLMQYFHTLDENNKFLFLREKIKTKLSFSERKFFLPKYYKILKNINKRGHEHITKYPYSIIS